MGRVIEPKGRPDSPILLRELKKGDTFIQNGMLCMVTQKMEKNTGKRMVVCLNDGRLMIGSPEAIVFPVSIELEASYD